MWGPCEVHSSSVCIDYFCWLKFSLQACNLRLVIKSNPSPSPCGYGELLPCPSGGGVIYIKEGIQICYNDQLGGWSPKGSDAWAGDFWVDDSYKWAVDLGSLLYQRGSQSTFTIINLGAPALKEMTHQQMLHLFSHPAACLQDSELKFFQELHPSHPTCISEY